MSRFFARITTDELKSKVMDAVKEHSDYDTDDGDSWDRQIYATLTPTVEKDIKVKFDWENHCDDGKDSRGQYWPQLLGYFTLKNGITCLGITAGGDWEHSVYFIIYWDGRKLRGYVPTEGNWYNTDTMTAFGNDEDKDAENIIRRFSFTKEADFNNDGELCPPDDCPVMIVNDIMTRIHPKKG